MAATDTRQRILDAALASFVDDGYEQTTIARIRERSRASNGALFHHFASKEAIADALYVEAIASFHEGVWELVRRRPRSLQAAIHATIAHQLAWTERNPDLARFVYARGHLDWDTPGGAEVAALNRELAEALGDWLAPLIERGEVRSRSMLMISALVGGPAHAIARRWLAGQVDGPLTAFTDELADAAHAALHREARSPTKGAAELSYKTLIWEQSGGVGRLTLNRPETLNAWTAEFGRELRQVVEREAADESVRAVLVTGAGRGFSSGADLKSGFEPAEDGMPNIRKDLHEIYHPAIAGIRRLPKPVVAAVNGPAVGIGCSLAIACDLVLAAESSFFGLAFVNIGLMPDGGSTAFVPPAIGKARAFQMALLGERVPAQQALEWGLVNWVYPDDRLMDEANALVGRLAAGPTRSYASSKQALNNFVYGDLDAQLHLEGELQHALGRTQDFLEGFAAFAEKRAPAFSGT
jgi:2-(1,2-epoxy-1,2-dihydrophenyl)acetyl-CoA isomerase